MPGPPPKPRALRIVSPGGYDVTGKRRVNTSEPTPEVGSKPPGWLTGLALEKWKAEAPRYTRLGLLTEVDAEAFATMCVLEVRFAAEAAATMPCTMQLIHLSRELRGLWGRFGKTPADRARVKVDKPKPESKLERLMSGTKRGA